MVDGLSYGHVLKLEELTQHFKYLCLRDFSSPAYVVTIFNLVHNSAACSLLTADPLALGFFTLNQFYIFIISYNKNRILNLT